MLSILEIVLCGFLLKVVSNSRTTRDDRMMYEFFLRGRKSLKIVKIKDKYNNNL